MSNTSMNDTAAANGLDHLTPNEITMLRSLRERGWAICLFTPWEINGACDQSDVEDAMASAGWDVIEWNESNKEN
jgi:hypothetical protein